MLKELSCLLEQVRLRLSLHFSTWDKGHTPGLGVWGLQVLWSILTVSEILTYTSEINSSTFLQELQGLPSFPPPVVRGPDSPHLSESLMEKRRTPAPPFLSSCKKLDPP